MCKVIDTRGLGLDEFLADNRGDWNVPDIRPSRSKAKKQPKLKQPWQMTREEYANGAVIRMRREQPALEGSQVFADNVAHNDAIQYHKGQVESAIERGDITSHPDYLSQAVSQPRVPQPVRVGKLVTVVKL